MYNEGEIIRISDVADPYTEGISQLFRKVKSLMISSKMTPEGILLQDRVVLTTLLKEKADKVVKCLSESHWTSYCIVTRKKFENMCGGQEEAYAVDGYSLNGETDTAFQIFQRIWDFNLRPKSITLVSILPICTKTGSLKYGKEIHAYAIRTGLGTAVSVGNSLIDMYCKLGRLELGATCSHAGLVDRGWSLYHSMIYDYNIPLDMEHYSCIVDLLVRAAHLDDAYDLIKKLPVEPYMNILGSLLGASEFKIRKMERGNEGQNNDKRKASAKETWKWLD
ncbi:hypothetical protein REPUB_Repub17cG0131500 [Reevesia pubescens]